MCWCCAWSCECCCCCELYLCTCTLSFQTLHHRAQTFGHKILLTLLGLFCDHLNLEATWQPCVLRFPSFLPHRFPGGRFRLFYKVLGLPGASGRGLREASLLRPILDHFGVHFGAHFGVHFGSILDLIWGVFCWKHEAINSTS